MSHSRVGSGRADNSTHRKNGNKRTSSEKRKNEVEETVDLIITAERLRSLYIQYRCGVGVFSESFSKEAPEQTGSESNITQKADGVGDLAMGSVSRVIRTDSKWVLAAESLAHYPMLPEEHILRLVWFCGLERVYLPMLFSQNIMKEMHDLFKDAYFPGYEEIETDFLCKLDKNCDILGFDPPYTDAQLVKATEYTIKTDGQQMSSVFLYCAVDKYQSMLSGVSNPRKIMTAVRDYCTHKSNYTNIWGDKIPSSLRVTTNKLINSTRRW